MDSPRIDFEQALFDPASVFATPEEVVAHPGLTRGQKIDVLKAWEYDAVEAAVATEEGMPGNENDLLRRVRLALASLAAPQALVDAAPTKQHPLLGPQDAT
jgi:hypothetical protein